MTEEPMTEPEPAAPGRHVNAGPMTDLVVPARRPVVRSVRRWPGLAVRARAQLEDWRHNPSAVLAMSAAATVGSALVTAGLRRTLRPAALAPSSRTASVRVGGYVVHEVHVFHHVVHHVLGPSAD